ncbi:calmodulin-binding protein 25-like [Carica papaya]|uniref:calmodulin-binding protein 25-like n=1 Tax=Carica papaya TaxID=3649 RepID=UPI000B8CDEB3|nr:calmodulin-binding protein 25-like [Carica papaya]
MASSDNLASIEPWMFRTSLADSWLIDAFSRDTDTLTKALQKSFSVPETFTSDSYSPFLDLLHSDSAPATPSLSASPSETAPKRSRNTVPLAGGKVSKRKSRASKRSHTTFITADPANFRQMVQQVTGVRFGGPQVPLVPIVKPEPQRACNRLASGGGAGCLPTLDTSAYLLDHQQTAVGDPSLNSPAGVGAFSGAVAGEGGGGGGVEMGNFPVFPTLESWKVL